MMEIVTKARDMGATDTDIARWLGKPLSGFGQTPLALIAAGNADAVLDALAAMSEGVFG